ncbi:MAG: ATP-binding cassette domain-containing protein, partial [Gammaproteobacteria bacterium]|nr:ATP-binding cassette domain-containing protein [Gammaproteobacteria bacterium]
MILVDSLSYEYPNVRALEDVSFHIPADSITALVGPNGAGKTTLLRCLAALDRPFSGTASVNGLDTQ